MLPGLLPQGVPWNSVVCAWWGAAAPAKFSFLCRQIRRSRQPCAGWCSRSPLLSSPTLLVQGSTVS